MPVIFAHISDTHLDGGARALERTAQVLGYLRGLPIDAILVTGDIADHGLASEYAEAARLLVAPVPILVLPGNHDARAPFRAGLSEEPASDAAVNQVRQVRGLTFALCDSTIPGRDEGELADDTLRWLEGVLDGTDGPVVVAMHHPPIRIGNRVIDDLLLREPARLERVLAGRRNVIGVLCGHAHAAVSRVFAGVPLVVAPGVVSSLMLDWELRGHLSFEQPPGFAFHVFDSGQLTSHYRYLTPTP